MFDKKLNYYEDDYQFSASFKWFTPVAFFLLFFCIAWDSFLLFWYSIALSGNAPWIMAVFPILHVAAGIGLTYYTICLFFNRTDISIADQQLDIHHSPIPWWKGNVNLPTKDIKQIYVKEKINSNKNGGQTRSYVLNCKMMDGSDKKLLNVGVLDAQQAKELEHRLEAFIGIDNEPVPGEYHTGLAPAAAPQARRQRKNADQSPLGYLQDLRIDDGLQIDDTNYTLSHLSQYDWHNGDSDKSMQLLSEDRQEQLLYLQQSMGLSKAWLEEKLPLFASTEINFFSQQPAASIQFGGKEYWLDQHYKGDAFINGSPGPQNIDQWLYQTKDQSAMLRIINFNSQIMYFTGSPLSPHQLQLTLDPGLELRDLDIEYRSSDDDEGFV